MFDCDLVICHLVLDASRLGVLLLHGCVYNYNYLVTVFSVFNLFSLYSDTQCTSLWTLNMSDPRWRSVELFVLLLAPKIYPLYLYLLFNYLLGYIFDPVELTLF